MDLIFFTHQETIANWIFGELEKFPEFSSLTCVTDSTQFMDAARRLKTYGVLIGQLRTRGYMLIEPQLRRENLLPVRRVLSAPLITNEFIRWANANKFDGIVDASIDPLTFGERAFPLFFPADGASSIIPSATSGTIPYRDLIDQGIVRMVAIGLTNEEIASRLNLALPTVRNRISRLLELSGARNRSHLAVMYLIPHAAEFRDDLSTEI
jgi:DNA-binding CsgD family transcriptional regulator